MLESIIKRQKKRAEKVLPSHLFMDLKAPFTIWRLKKKGQLKSAAHYGFAFAIPVRFDHQGSMFLNRTPDLSALDINYARDSIRSSGIFTLFFMLTIVHV